MLFATYHSAAHQHIGVAMEQSFWENKWARNAVEALFAQHDMAP
tara:strand:+ start:1402 stop:1533 length:132 start_codon:yes stop_codon:yes gene_type:complete